MATDVVLADGSFFPETGGWAAAACDLQLSVPALSHGGSGCNDCATAECLALLAGIRCASDIYPYPPGRHGVPSQPGGYGYKYRLRVRLARRLGATTVVIDRTSVLSNLRWEVDKTGKKAADPAYRAFVRLVLADFLESAMAQGGDAALTIMGRRVAVRRGLAQRSILRRRWPPHSLIEGRGWPNMPPPIDLLTDVSGTFWETQQGDRPADRGDLFLLSAHRPADRRDRDACLELRATRRICVMPPQLQQQHQQHAAAAAAEADAAATSAAASATEAAAAAAAPGAAAASTQLPPPPPPPRPGSRQPPVPERSRLEEFLSLLSERMRNHLREL